MKNHTPSQIPPYLESAVKDLAARTFGKPWDGSDGIEALLKAEGFAHQTLQIHKHAIKTLFLTAREKHDKNLLYPIRPLPPLSPSHSVESSGSNSSEQGPAPSTGAVLQDQRDPPQTVHVHIEGDTYDPINCVHTQAHDESWISYDVLENKGMTERIRDSKIRLIWKRSYCDKTTTTLFHVVGGDRIESSDIEFGKMWLEGLPRHVVPLSKKRKGFAEPDSNIAPNHKRHQSCHNIDLNSEGTQELVTTLLAKTIQKLVANQPPHSEDEEGNDDSQWNDP